MLEHMDMKWAENEMQLTPVLHEERPPHLRFFDRSPSTDEEHKRASRPFGDIWFPLKVRAGR